MTTLRFDELIHQSTRLSIMSLLARTDWIAFAFIRDQLGLSDSALSKQLSTLEDADYVTLEQIVGPGRLRLRAQITPAGRTAFGQHVVALQQIVGGATLSDRFERTSASATSRSRALSRCPSRPAGARCAPVTGFFRTARRRSRAAARANRPAAAWPCSAR